jgi:hypothetical protein
MSRVEEGTDTAEKIRLAIIMVGLALNCWVMWDYLSDRPEIQIMKARAKKWWDKAVEAPAREAKKMRRAEAETVFEALTIVEGTNGGY